MKTVGRFLVQKCICFNTPVETTGVTFPLDPSHPTDKGGPSAAEAMFASELGDFDRWIYARVPGRHVGVARCPNGLALSGHGGVPMRVT